MGRHSEPSPPPARGRDAVAQWVGLVVFGAGALLLCGGLFMGAVAAIAGWVDSDSWWPAAMEDLGRYGVPYALGIGLFVLCATLTRNRIYRLLGRSVPRGSGGGVYV